MAWHWGAAVVMSAIWAPVRNQKFATCNPELEFWMGRFNCLACHVKMFAGPHLFLCIFPLFDFMCTFMGHELTICNKISKAPFIWPSAWGWSVFWNVSVCFNLFSAVTWWERKLSSRHGTWTRALKILEVCSN